MTPVDPKTLIAFVESLLWYGSVDVPTKRTDRARVYTNPWYRDTGESYIFISDKGFVRAGRDNKNSFFMSAKSVTNIANRKTIIPMRTHTTP